MIANVVVIPQASYSIDLLVHACIRLGGWGQEIGSWPLNKCTMMCKATLNWIVVSHPADSGSQISYNIIVCQGTRLLYEIPIQVVERK